MIKKTICLIASALCLLLFFHSNSLAGQHNRLKIYCGITMVQAMGEIANKFEKKHNCKRIQIVKGGSGKLLKQLLDKQDGDLYLPGYNFYIEQLQSKYPGFVLDQAHVGYNQAALFVKKGNPKQIMPTLSSLLNSNYKVVIGDPGKGSIGKETKKLLQKKGIYQQVLQHAQTTPHSKKLTQAIKTGKADISINWFAVSIWPENIKFIEAFPIDSQYAHKEKLVMATLKTSNQQVLAKALLDYAASDEGKAIFKKFGLYNK